MPEPLNVCFTARWTTPSCSSVIRISRNPPKCLRCREIWTCFSFSEISAAVSVKWRRQFHSLKKTSCEELNSSNSFQNKHTLKKLYFWSLSKVFQMISFRFFSSSSSSLIFFFMANNWFLFPVYVYFSLLIHHVYRSHNRNLETKLCCV